MLPWAFGSITFLACHAFSRGREQGLAPHTRGHCPARCSRGPSAWGGKVSRLCLALETCAAAVPEGTTRSRPGRAQPEDCRSPNRPLPCGGGFGLSPVGRDPKVKAGAWPPLHPGGCWRRRGHRLRRAVATRIRDTRRCLGSVGRQLRPKAVPTTSRAIPKDAQVSSDPAFARCPDPRRDPSAARRLGCSAPLAHPKMCFAARHPSPPPGGERAAPPSCPKADGWGGRAPKGPPWLPISQRAGDRLRPDRQGSIANGQDRSPCTDPKADAPTWIRRGMRHEAAPSTSWVDSATEHRSVRLQGRTEALLGHLQLAPKALPSRGRRSASRGPNRRTGAGRWM